jgi:nitrous oxidase accessory protein NosD
MKRTLLFALTLSLFVLPTQAQTPNAWINEVHYDNDGADTGEFLEIVIENPGSYALSDFKVVRYNGADQLEDETETVDNLTEGGTQGNYTLYTWSPSSLQNGSPDGVALCYQGSPVSSGGVAQFLSYEGTFTAADECASGQTSVDIGESEGGSTAIGESLQLTGTGSEYTSFSWNPPAPDSPGSVNAGQTFTSATGPVTNTDTNESFPTIQAAIDDVDTDVGDVIEVSAGTYTETVTVNKPLTLNGPNAGTPGAGSRSPEATIDGQVIIEASGATIDGFDVSPPPATSNPEGEAIRVSGGADNVVVANNIVRDFNGNSLPEWEGLDGINVFGTSDAVKSVTISDNLVKNLDGRDTKGGAAGISIQGNVDGATVTQNTVTNIGQQATTWAFGIVVRGTGNDPTFLPSNVDITNNNVSSILSDPATQTVGVGFGLEDGAVSSVSSNTFTNTELQAEDKTTGFDLISDFVANNTLDRTVVIDDGSADGVKDEGTAPDQVQRVYSTVSAPVSRAVAGETVRVFSGTYEESLTIDKALTLRGASAGGSTSSSLTMASKSTPPSCTAGAVIDASGSPQGLTVSADNVTLENLCVTGAQSHNIYTDASISNLTLTGVEALNAGNYGLEIHNNASVTTLSITNSTFSGNRVGMRIRGTVSDLTIDGSAFDHNNYGFYTTLGGNVEQERADGGSTNVSDVTITNTTFNDNPNKGIYAEKLDNATFENIEVINSGTDVNASFFPQAIDINLKLRNYGALTFRNATVRGSIGEGLNVKARNGFYGGAYQPPDDASLSSLTVENSVFAGNRWGVVVGYGVEDAEITGNLVNNNGNAVGAYQDKSNLDFNRGGVLFYATPEAATFTVNGNCITKNGLTERDGFTGYGLSTTDTPVDATNNWWGSAAGPGTGGANSAEGAATVDPFAIDPVSGVEGCGGATDECKPSKFEEIIVSNQPPGEVKITINDTEGIDQVRFYEVSNFTIASEQGDFDDPDDDGIWTPSGSSTSTTFMLTQADTDNPDASYFAQITNGCGTLTDIDPPHGFDVAPVSFALEGNYPNPFRTQTTLQFDLPEPVDVTLSVYDVMGRRVATLVQERLPAGSHDITWQGRGQNGQALASGVYFMRLTAGDRTATRRLTIVR